MVKLLLSDSELHLIKHQQEPLLSHAGSAPGWGRLCAPWLSLSPDHGCPRSTATLWQGLKTVSSAGARAHGEAAVGNLTAARVGLSLPSLGGQPACLHSSWAELGLLSPSVCCSGLSTSEGNLFPLSAASGLGYPVCGLICSLPRSNVQSNCYFFFSFQPNYMCIFLTVWLCRCPSASFLLSFQWGLFHTYMYFLCIWGWGRGGELYVLLTLPS